MTLDDWTLLILCAISVSSSILGIKLENDFIGRIFFGLIIVFWVLILGFHFSGLIEVR